MAKSLKAMAHPMRIVIVDALKDGDRCVRDLTSLGSINQSNVSRHLATLKRVGIVSDRRVKNQVIYKLEAPEVLDLLSPAASVARSELKRHADKVNGLSQPE
ncbi:MAG TPA: metalloregulator ArsR/SmtB family transcription factor [Tichowtungia sp.]|nr:metalloregulator ArsR/SmtB family transcription factor [Tichowtungia sp.]